MNNAFYLPATTLLPPTAHYTTPLLPSQATLSPHFCTLLHTRQRIHSGAHGALAQQNSHLARCAARRGCAAPYASLPPSRLLYTHFCAGTPPHCFSAVPGCYVAHTAANKAAPCIYRCAFTTSRTPAHRTPWLARYTTFFCMIPFRALPLHLIFTLTDCHLYQHHTFLSMPLLLHPPILPDSTCTTVCGGATWV